MSPKFILGSSSKWRKCVVEENLPEVHVHMQMSPDIDEKAIRHDVPEIACQMIAQAKAEELKPALRMLCQENADAEYLLLTADQVVKYEGTMREKPESPEENFAFLKSYTRETPLFSCSAVCITHFPSERMEEGVDVVKVMFDNIPDDVIHAVIAKGDTLECCGGFTVEDLQEFMVDLKEADVPSIQGLPVDLVRSLMGKLSERVS